MSADDGWALVSMYDNGGEYRTARCEFARLLAEWKAGAAFIELVTLDGARVVVKGARVEAVADMSADAVDSWNQRTKAQRKERESEL